MTSHAVLADCRNGAMDCIALNQMQAMLILNPSPEVDSLAERVIALRRHSVPEHLIGGLIADVRALLDLNAREGDGQRSVVGTLDGLAVAQHAAARPPLATGRPAGVKRLAADLRAAMDASDDALLEVAAAHPRSRLLQRSLRHELGVRRSARLMAALGTLDAQEAA